MTSDRPASDDSGVLDGVCLIRVLVMEPGPIPRALFLRRGTLKSVLNVAVYHAVMCR